MTLYLLQVTVLLVASLSGCSTAQIFNSTETTYRHETFSSGQLAVGGVALLPVVANNELEGYRRALGDSLNAYLPLYASDGEMMIWQTSMDSINSHDIVDDYRAMIENYQQTAVIDRNRVIKIGDALGVRYALYCSLISTTRDLGAGLNEVTVAAYCLVLDLEAGDIKQEIRSSASALVGGMVGKLPPFENFAQSVAQSVLAELNPALAPKKVVKERSNADGYND